MNLPNKITLFRVILIPFFLVFLLVPSEIDWELLGIDMTLFQSIALVLFVFASLSDWLDGYIARKKNLVTDFGKFLDPLADKLLVAAAFIAFVELGLAPSWIVIVIITREFAVTGLRLVASGKGEVIAAGFSGKIKTTIQMITIIFLLLNISASLNLALLLLSAIITLYSGIEYFVQNRKIIASF